MTSVTSFTPLAPRPVPHFAMRSALSRMDSTAAALTVFLAPMNYLRLDQIYVTASDGAALLCLFLLILQGRLPRHPFGPATGIWLLGYALLCAGLVLSSVIHGAPWPTLTVISQYTFALLILPLVIGGRDRAEMLFLIKVLIASVVVVMAFGIWIVDVSDDHSHRFVSYSGRLQSLVERENELAALGAIAVTLACGLYQIRAIRLLTLLSTLAVIGYGITLTGSNTGLACTALGIGLLLLLSGSLRLAGMALLSAMGVAMILMIGGIEMLPATFRNRVLGALESGDLSHAGTFTDRMQLIKEAFGVARHTVFIGLGADQYRTVSTIHAPVHNTYLLLLCEGGLIALLGLILLLLTGVYLIWLCWRHQGLRIEIVLIVSVLMIYAAMLNTFPHFYARFWNIPLILVYARGAACLQAPRRAMADPSEVSS